MINFSNHLKEIIRQKEQELDKKIIRMHKREREFPFTGSIENKNFSLNQIKFNYPALENIYQMTAEYYGIKSNELILTAGCDIALRTIYESLENLSFLHLPNSCYAMNYVYKKIYHPKTVVNEYEFDKKGHISTNELIAKLSRSSDLQMVVVESPSGFTGQGLEESEFKKLLDYCEMKNIILVVDETYLETRSKYWTAKKYIDYQNLIVVSSFSKAYGIAGLRAGIIVSNSLNIKTLSTLLPMHEITSFTNYLLEKVITDESLELFRKQIKNDENLIFDQFDNKWGFEILKTETNFILFRNKKLSCKFIHDFILDNQIKVKIHKSVPFFGEWCSASLGNEENTNYLIKVLTKLK